MPTYEYQCDICDKVSDQFVNSSRERRLSIKCPYCFSGTAWWVISAPHIGGSHVNKMTESVPGESKSISVDGFKVVKTPEHVRKKIRRGARRLKKKREPRRLKTVKEY